MGLNGALSDVRFSNLSRPEESGGILDGCLGRSGSPVLGGDGLEDLTAMDLDAFGGLDAQPHAIFGDAEDDDLDLATDDDGLFLFPSDHQHSGRLTDSFSPGR